MTASALCVKLFAGLFVAAFGLIILLVVMNRILARELEQSYREKNKLPTSILRAQVVTIAKNCSDVIMKNKHIRRCVNACAKKKPTESPVDVTGECVAT